MNKIKPCVSFYSYQDAYATGRYTLDQLFEEQVNLGLDGFEFITDQMMRGTPRPEEKTLEAWDALMAKYPLQPVCNDIFINTKLYRNRLLTQKEGVMFLKDEIQLAKRLGFTIVRMVGHTPWNLVMPVMELAEKNNVRLAFEIHGGMGFNTEATQAQLSEIKKINSPYLGLVIDTSLFCRSLPKIIRNLAKSFGVSESALEYIDGIYTSGKCPNDVFRNGIPADMEPSIQSPADRMIVPLIIGYENNPMHVLDELMPYIMHFHGKLIAMKEDGGSDGNDWQEIIDYLTLKKYSGYISTEYEGQRYKGPDEASNEIEVVRAHQKLLRRCIDTASAKEV